MLGLWIAAGVFAVLGAVFALGRGGFLIAGWNVMSPEERSRCDEKAVFRNMSGLMLCIAGCLALMGLGEALGIKWLPRLGQLALVPCVIFFVIRINRAEKKK